MNANASALLGELRSTRVLVVLRSLPPDVVVLAVRALAHGGLRLFEVTTDSPAWEESVKRLSSGEAAGKGATQFGAGTVLDGGLAERARRAGATFLVSPILSADVAQVARDGGLGYIPGAFTPGEIHAASVSGATCVKVFPADTGGPAHIARILQPMPFLKLIPTGGVTMDTAPEYLKAGAIGVAMGSGLIDPTALLSGHLDATAAKVVRLLAALTRR